MTARARAVTRGRRFSRSLDYSYYLTVEDVARDSRETCRKVVTFDTFSWAQTASREKRAGESLTNRGRPHFIWRKRGPPISAIFIITMNLNSVNYLSFSLTEILRLIILGIYRIKRVTTKKREAF